MSVFKLKSPAGNVWPGLCHGSLTTVWAAFKELEQTQWLGREELEAGQLCQVRQLLAHCMAFVPYYRRVLRDAGIVADEIRTMEDFRRVPLLPRRTYQQHTDEFIAEQLPAGSVESANIQTSGSSGTPTRVYQTNVVNIWWLASYMRDLEWAGIDPTGTNASIRSSGSKGAKLKRLMEGERSSVWIKPLDQLYEMGPMYSLEISQDHARQFRWLHEVNPDYILSYPSNLEVLALMARQEGAPSNLRLVRAISDTLTDQTREAIEEGFGVPVRNTYSSAESGYLASQCPEAGAMHVFGENVILEVLDDSGLPCQPGQTGRVHLTTLHNFRGPFVRYDVGDLATVGERDCPCGRGLPVLARVIGKEAPMFRIPGGRRKDTTRLTFLMRKAGGHWQHQVVQKAEDHVVVRIVKNPDWSDERVEKINKSILDFFEQPIRVDIEFHDRLGVPESGKFQNMIIEMP